MNDNPPGAKMRPNRIFSHHRPVALVLSCTVAGLLAYGGGIFVWTVVAAILAGSGIILFDTLTDGNAGTHATGDAACLAAAVALLAFLVLTVLPLPLWASRVTGRERYRQNAALSTLAQRADRSESFTAPRLSFAVTRNRAGTIRIILLGLLSGIGAGLGRRLTRCQRKGFLALLCMAGAVTSIAGYLGQWVIPQGDTLWYWIPVAHGRPGPAAGFINPNHYAGFLALLLPVAITAAAGALRDGPRGLPRLTAALLLCGLLTGAIATSLSRGGMLSAMAGAGATLVMLIRGRRRNAAAALLVAALLIVPIALVIRHHAPAAHRLQTLRDPFRTTSFIERTDAWKGALRIWRRYPFIGCGANAFRVTYPQARHTSERASRTFAENEYVQWIAETGIVGLILLVAVIAALIRRWREGIPDPRHNTTDDALLAGVITVAAVHAGGDFVLRLPLYTFTLAALIGMHPRFRRLTMPPASSRPIRYRLCAPAAGCFLTAVIFLPWTRAAMERDNLGYASRATGEQIVKALSWAPVAPHLWVRLGERLARSDDPALHPLAGDAAMLGSGYDPNNYRLWLRTGELLLRIGDREAAAIAFREVRRLRDWVPIPDMGSLDLTL